MKIYHGTFIIRWSDDNGYHTLVANDNESAYRAYTFICKALECEDHTYDTSISILNEMGNYLDPRRGIDLPLMVSPRPILIKAGKYDSAPPDYYEER